MGDDPRRFLAAVLQRIASQGAKGFYEGPTAEKIAAAMQPGNGLITTEDLAEELVGEIAARIRKLRKPDPYKGKGVRYAGENIRRKVGKTGK